MHRVIVTKSIGRNLFVARVSASRFSVFPTNYLLNVLQNSMTRIPRERKKDRHTVVIMLTEIP